MLRFESKDADLGEIYKSHLLPKKNEKVNTAMLELVVFLLYSHLGIILLFLLLPFIS